MRLPPPPVLTGELMYPSWDIVPMSHNSELVPTTNQSIMKDEWLTGQENNWLPFFTGTSWHLQWHSLLHGFNYF